MIITDLDGTLFDNRHRAHLLPPKGCQGRAEAWAAFNLACLGDAPIAHNIAAHNAHAGFRILLTGRAEVARANTLTTLRRHGVSFTRLIMRPNNCHDRAEQFKYSILRGLFGRTPERFTFMDDDPQVCEMVRREYPYANVIQVPSLCADVINR